MTFTWKMNSLVCLNRNRKTKLCPETYSTIDSNCSPPLDSYELSHLTRASSFRYQVQVFLAEYIGPLFIYLLFYFRVPYIYSQQDAFTSSSNSVVTLACACHTCHYIKRLIETIFVHRFSHGTMPLRTIVRNCVYYWTFSAWLAFYINHPLYTPPCKSSIIQTNHSLCEAGNFSIHVALNNLKAEGGTKCRKFPLPTKNPFTWLFFLVSCPNYTYEVNISCFYDYGML
uniref:Trans-2,3-enoyl-CoA reductase-like 2a n=1 Tax=Hucho hucho TaxID=62062 RepID=A0A4W5JT63_9TELE